MQGKERERADDLTTAKIRFVLFFFSTSVPLNFELLISG